MLAAVLYEVDKLVLEERPTPTPKPDEAVVRIKSCGICATDYKAIKGIRKNVRFPLVPGHEPAGIVAAHAVICLGIGSRPWTQAGFWRSL